MLAVLFGLIVTGAAATALWRLLPREGVVHPLATMPVLESVVPIAIVGGLAIGVAMIATGLTVF